MFLLDFLVFQGIFKKIPQKNTAGFHSCRTQFKIVFLLKHISRIPCVRLGFFLYRPSGPLNLHIHYRADKCSYNNRSRHSDRHSPDPSEHSGFRIDQRTAVCNYMKNNRRFQRAELLIYITEKESQQQRVNHLGAVLMQMVYALLLGLFLCYVYQKFGSLKAPVVFI